MVEDAIEVYQATRGSKIFLPRGHIIAKARREVNEQKRMFVMNHEPNSRKALF